MTVTCVWCGEELRFVVGKGWIHLSDGQMYRQNPDGTDNHCALPRFEEENLLVHREEDKGAVFLNVRTTFPVEAVITIGEQKVHLKGQAKFNIIRQSWKFADELQMGIFCDKGEPIKREIRNPSQYNRVEIVGLPLEIGLKIFDKIRELAKRG